MPGMPVVDRTRHSTIRPHFDHLLNACSIKELSALPKGQTLSKDTN